jgi:Spy/CpxP family protein refolding chaperone
MTPGRKENEMKRTLVMTTALFLAVSGAAWAQPRHGGMGHGPGMPGPGEVPPPEDPLALHGMMRLLDRLDLTEAQWDEVDGILEAARGDVGELMESGAAPGGMIEEFLEVFSRETVTASDFEALAGRMEERRAAVRAIGSRAIADIHDVLTDEQLERIRTFLESGPPMGGGGFTR